jgi:flagellar hook-associated protein 2
MVEVTKPDYLSLVNKGGSGFNISELVTSIVASEIEPKRILENSKLEKTENAVTGFGYLYSQAAKTKTNFATIKTDSFFNLTSSKPDYIDFSTIDEAKIVSGIRSISDIEVAKNMVLELGSFSNLTDTFTANLTIDAGKWTQTDTLTYLFTGNVPANRQTISFTGETLTQIAARFDELDGISAKVIDKTGDATSYSLVLTGVETGLENGFKIAEVFSDHADRWQTPTVPSANAFPNAFTQLSRDATFKLDGISVSRDTNKIDDLIDGVSIDLRSDISETVTLNLNRSESTIIQNVKDVIFSLNEFRTELERLTFIDVEGDENGPLAMELTATMLKSKFKKLAIDPITGYGSQSIYLSQLGIKLNNSGEFYFDEGTYQKTLTVNPEFFMALKNENLKANTNLASISKSQYTNIPAGTYTVAQDGTSWKFGDIVLTRADADNGGSVFTSNDLPGLTIETIERNPASFDIYVGKSFCKKIDELMTETLAIESSFYKSEEAYKNLKIDIQDRLDELAVREKLITSRYNKQFGNMENVMTQFNSTKSLLENFIESWKKT